MKRYLAVFCTFFWAGLIAGISFLEAPLKFQAPGITIPLGLGIGQLVFQALNKIEIAFFLVLSCCMLGMNLKNYKGILYAILLAVMLFDTFWLLPLLDKRAILVLKGVSVKASYHHILYIIFESIKLLALLILGFLNLKDSHEKRH
ncbi:hypothetical protein [Pedobacter rhizosphaerae]|uniref:DUF4149 domain-containing protein n=1 Tax=Pedobacter rhizosphaerae TaxID=390241 RepID=A0A1H9Q7G4_9SPHI|nr:hypothetical protein [Pedobacter rhizosphaerae]SER55773.1 hypothetical protein SAMN04488023_11143 [Pedobacter rhizosphaerae]